MIRIKKFSGVAPPTEESKALFDALINLKGENLLELGTGTGFVAIAASKKGKKVTATDINPLAIKACELNSKLNNVYLEIIQSDLFENVKGKFDIIAFNPPISIDKANSVFTHKVKSFIRGTKLLRSFLRSTYSKLNKSILILINRLFTESKNHLNKEGSILICVLNNFENEIKEISNKKGFDYEILKDFNYGKVYRFYLK